MAKIVSIASLMSETVNYSNCDLQSMIVVTGDYDWRLRRSRSDSE